MYRVHYFFLNLSLTYTCVYMYAGMHTCMHIQKQEVNIDCLHIIFFWNSLSHWDWSSPFHLGWLGSELVVSSPLCSPSARVTGAHHHIWLWPGCWGSERRFSSLRSSHLPSPWWGSYLYSSDGRWHRDYFLHFLVMGVKSSHTSQTIHCGNVCSSSLPIFKNQCFCIDLRIPTTMVTSPIHYSGFFQTSVVRDGWSCHLWLWWLQILSNQLLVGALAVISCTVLVIGEERRYPGLAPDFRETTPSSNVTAALALLIAFPRIRKFSPIFSSCILFTRNMHWISSRVSFCLYWDGCVALTWHLWNHTGFEH